MSDINQQINDHLAEENQRLSGELDKMRALLERPVTVNIQAPEQNTLKRIGEYLPKFGELAVNTAMIAGQLMQHGERYESANAALTKALREQTAAMTRIATALERAYPIEEE